MKKRICLISFILLCVFIVISFLPIIFMESYWKADTPGRGIYTHKWDALCSMFGLGNEILGVLVLLFAAVGVVVLILQFTGNTKPSLAKLTLAPLVALLFFAVLSIVNISTTVPNGTPYGTATLGYNGYFSHSFGWGWYIAAALLIATSVMSFFVATGRVKDSDIEKKEKKTTEADDIVKYKDLLDKGIITQEEFDAKKKQLLGL